MDLEVLLAWPLAGALLAVAYARRRSFISAHLAALALFAVALPPLVRLFGAQPLSASDETLYYVYAAIALYAGFMVAASMAGRDDGLARVATWIRNVTFSPSDLSIAIATYLVLWMSRGYKALVYGIAVSGSGTEEAVRELPYWLSTFHSLAELLGGGVLIVLVTAATKGASRWLWSLVAIELVWAFVSGGRREVLFVLFTVAWILWQARAMTMPAVVSVVAIGMSLVYVASPLFLETRNANATLLRQGLPASAALVYAISDAYQRCGIGVGCAELLEDNIASRGNAIEFMKEVVGSERSGYPFMYGSAVLDSLRWGVPSIVAAKPPLMTEQAIQAAFGLPLGDVAISMPVLAYADMGLVGCVIAGLLMGVYIRCFSWLLFHQQYKMLTITLAYGLVRALWNIEGDPLAYVVLLRDGLLLIAIAQALTVGRQAVAAR